MPRDVGSVTLRDIGVVVVTRIYDLRVQKGLPMYFHWILFVSTMDVFEIKGVNLQSDPLRLSGDFECLEMSERGDSSYEFFDPQFEDY